MSKLMELVDVKIPTQRSGFDMSQKVCFSAKAGELLPVWWQEMIPSEKKRVNLQSFSRTQPVNTSAYTRLREYFDFYFVPYTQLWKQWKQFALQMNDNAIYSKDINNSQTISDEHPYFTYKQVADYVSTCASLISRPGKVNTLNELGFARDQTTCKLLQYLGYGNFYDYIKVEYTEEMYTDTDNKLVEGVNPHIYFPNNIALNPFPLLAYQKIYQDKYRNTQWEKSSPFTYNLDYITGNDDLQIPVESIDGSDNVTMFDLKYCDWNKDYYMGLLPRSQYGDEAVVPISPYLNRNTTVSMSSGYLTGNTNVALDSTNAVFSGPSVPPAGDSGSYFFRGGLRGASDNESLTLLVNLPSDSVASAVDGLNILLLRQYEMLQRYNEVRQSAKTDYKEQIEKLFGVSLSWKDSNQVKWLGGVARNFDISEVVNTNISGDNSAEIAGKGVSVSDGNVEIDVQDEYGIVMCIYHVMPILDYQLDAPLKCNTKFKFSDYAQPAFDRIGMQAIPTLELFNSRKILSRVFGMYNLDDTISERRQSIATEILGYGPRYLDYKTSIDRVLGVFTTTRPDWVTPFSDDFLLQSIPGPSLPTPSSEKYGITHFSYVNFKVSPRILDTIFPIDANDSVDTDQFLVNAFFEVSDVKNLDYNGLPY